MFDGVFYDFIYIPADSPSGLCGREICSTGLSYTLSALIISQNVTLVPDKSTGADKAASPVRPTVRETVGAHKLQPESVFLTFREDAQGSFTRQRK